ncbi:hypothetical protein SCWH03_53290 [Streptomyces pacificus]|uniref:Uncharacterized protein n=1 Tax=Streptomyces pacificus TaxID=2705029 RepID=A0A6A0B413_9ACTN|nr:hypothetical protein SCWH03_53290 [Streptomyces pacificus]
MPESVEIPAPLRIATMAMRRAYAGDCGAGDPVSPRARARRQGLPPLRAVQPAGRPPTGSAGAVPAVRTSDAASARRNRTECAQGSPLSGRSAPPRHAPGVEWFQTCLLSKGVRCG